MLCIVNNPRSTCFVGAILGRDEIHCGCNTCVAAIDQVLQASSAFRSQVTSTGRRVTVVGHTEKHPSKCRSNSWRKLLQLRGVDEDILTAEARDLLCVVLDACDQHRQSVLCRQAFSAWAAWTKGVGRPGADPDML
jgi:hypothetical protein